MEVALSLKESAQRRSKARCHFPVASQEMEKKGKRGKPGTGEGREDDVRRRDQISKIGVLSSLESNGRQ